MHTSFSTKSATSLFEIAFYALQDAPITLSRGHAVKELNNVTLVLQKPQNCVVTTPERRMSHKYLIAKWLWYVSGNRSVKNISKFSNFWSSIADDHGLLNSNYGYYFFNPMDQVLPTEEEFKPITDYYYQKSQFDFVIDTLVNDQASRQAIVNINNIYHKARKTKDFPCAISMQFFIKNGRLNMSVIMRSSDLVLEFCEDIFQFYMFYECVRSRLNDNKITVGYGEITVFITSLQLSEKHWNLVSPDAEQPDINPLNLEYYFGETLSYENFRKILVNDKSMAVYRKRLIEDFGENIVKF